MARAMDRLEMLRARLERSPRYLRGNATVRALLGLLWSVVLEC